MTITTRTTAHTVNSSVILFCFYLLACAFFFRVLPVQFALLNVVGNPGGMEERNQTDRVFRGGNPKQGQGDCRGFPCPEEFVVGYGMDFNYFYRCLPFVAVLNHHV